MAGTRDTHRLLRRAVAERMQIVAEYQGHHREACPHVLGAKQGRRRVLCYQFAGSSGSGLPPEGEWRCFDVDGLSRVAVRPGRWHTAATGGAWPGCVDVVDLAVPG